MHIGTYCVDSQFTILDRKNTHVHIPTYVCSKMRRLQLEHQLTRKGRKKWLSEWVDKNIYCSIYIRMAGTIKKSDIELVDGEKSKSVCLSVCL